MKPRRPGRGGHQPRATVLSSTTATQDLLAEIGPPDIDERRHGIGFLYWRLEGSGTALGLARLSSDEIKNGEGVLQQVHAIRHLIDREPSLKLGHLVATTDNSGSRAFEARPDLMLLDELISAGEVTALVARDTDRLIRNDMARATLEELLKASRTDLYLCSKGGRLDLNKEMLTWRVQGIIAEVERNAIVSRTESGWVQARLAEGQGRPGAVPFGFYWDRQFAQVRVDPDQWEWVIFIHEGYERLCEQGHPGGLRALEKELADKCPLSRTHIRTILMNPIYVTGEYTVRWRGNRVTAIPVKLDRPIPLELFQRNQERLALNRGPNSVAPVGFFALNSIPVLHGTCMDLRVPPRVRQNQKGLASATQPVLRGRGHQRQGRPPVYGHYPRSPECCKRYVIHQDVLEPVVMRELLRLASCPELQEEWRRAPRSRSAPKVRMLTKERRAAVVQELEDLRRRRAALEERWVDSSSAEAKMDPEAYLNLVLPLSQGIQRLERQLELDGKLATRREPAKVAGAMERLASAVDLDDETTYAELLDRLKLVLTESPPEDPDLMRQRAAVVAASLSAVVVRDVPGGITVELRGPLVPPDWRSDQPIGPIASAHRVLSPFLPTTAGPATPTPDAAELELSATGAGSGRFQLEEQILPYDQVPTAFWEETVIEWMDRRPQRDSSPASSPTPGPDWEPEWTSPATLVPTAWITGHGRRLDIAIAAVRRAAELMDSSGRVTSDTYVALRRDHPEGPMLPPYTFLNGARKAHGLTWSQLVARACPRQREERPLRDFIRPGLSRAQLRWAIKNGRLRANPRGGRWFTTKAWVDDFLGRREEARAQHTGAPDRLPGRAGAEKPSPRPDRLKGHRSEDGDG